MSNVLSYSRHPQDEPVLQQLETYVQHLSSGNKAAIAALLGDTITSPQQDISLTAKSSKVAA